MTPKEFKEKHKYYLTVGKLKEYLENYPDDALVVAQRVEDRYYEGIDISDITGMLPDGTFGKLPEGTKAHGWETLKKPDGYSYSEYSAVWAPVLYHDDKECFYLDLHY